MSVKFNLTTEERQLVEMIVDRAIVADESLDRLAVTMDITACHRNGTPLKLAELLTADDFNFSHDVFGIRRHLDRKTGKLLNHFFPRYARKADDETNPELESRADGHDTRHYDSVEGGAR